MYYTYVIMEDNFKLTNATDIIEAQKKAPSLNKKLTIAVVICVISIIIAIVAIVVFLNKKHANDVAIEKIQSSSIVATELDFIENSEYSDILNIFANLENGISSSTLDYLVEKSKLDSDSIHINKTTGTGYIATSIINTQQDYTGQNIEYITFIINEENSDLMQIEDITYHSYHDGKYDYIREESEESIIHYSDGLTNSFESLEYAIDDYLMRL